MSKVNSFILLEKDTIEGNTEKLTSILSEYNLKTISVTKSGDPDTLRFKLALSQVEDKDAGILLVKDTHSLTTDPSILKNVIQHVLNQSTPMVVHLNKSYYSDGSSVDTVKDTSVSLVKDDVYSLDAVLLNSSAIESIKKNFDTSIVLTNKSISDDDVPLKSPKFYDDDLEKEVTEPTVSSSIIEALTSMIRSKSITSLSTYPNVFTSKDAEIVYYNPTDAIPSDIPVTAATNIGTVQNAMNTVYAPSSTESMMYSGWFLFILVLLLIILLVIIIFSYYTQEDYYYYQK